MMEIFLLLSGGVGLFILAIHRLSHILTDSLFDKAKYYLKKFTRNSLTGVLTGLIATIILDSSSAVIVLTIILVNAKAITFRESIGIVLGSNVGTTFSSQMIALDLNGYSALILIAGIIISLLAKSEKWKKTGEVILYLGMLFFALYIVQLSLIPLRDNMNLMEKLKNLGDPINGALIGGLITLIIQSSSATVGLVITLAKQGFINLSGGIAVMLGAEFGTCTDTIVAIVGGKRRSIKTGLFHIIFNLICIILGLVFFQTFTSFIDLISAGQHIETKIANAHFLFNFIGVLLFLPFIPLVENLLNRLLPDKKPQELVAGTQEI